MTSRDSQQGEDSSRKNSPQGKPKREEKPSVPLEKLIERTPHRADTEAADRLASEAAKAPEPAVETPDPSHLEREDSVVDLVENDRRQKS